MYYIVLVGEVLDMAPVGQAFSIWLPADLRGRVHQPQRKHTGGGW